MSITNRTYNREYATLEKYEAGIALTGAEVKSVRAQMAKLDGGFVKILEDGPYLMNAEINIYQFTRPQGYDPRRSRKLLLHKKELIRLRTKLKAAKGLTLIPLVMYTKGHLIKVEIALSKGKTDIEKRKHEKSRDVTRAIEKEIKEYMK